MKITKREWWILAGWLVTTGIAGYSLWASIRRPDLYHAMVETLPFEGEDQSRAIYYVTLTNEGNREAENAVCTVQIKGAKIEEM